MKGLAYVIMGCSLVICSVILKVADYAFPSHGCFVEYMVTYFAGCGVVILGMSKLEKK